MAYEWLRCRQKDGRLADILNLGSHFRLQMGAHPDFGISGAYQLGSSRHQEEIANRYRLLNGAARLIQLMIIRCTREPRRKIQAIQAADSNDTEQLLPYIIDRISQVSIKLLTKEKARKVQCRMALLAECA